MDAVASPEVWTYLDRIVHRIEDGAHIWEIYEPDTLEASEWLKAGRRGFLELFEGAVRRASYPSGDLHKRRVVVSLDPANGALTPQKAARYVSKPLAVLVENRFTDGKLLDTALELLAPESLRLLLGSGVPDLILCDGPGGNGELPKLIEEYVALAAADGLPNRIVVFTDSDGRYPGHVSKEAHAIDAVCRKYDIPCCILKKRCIENYIPDEVLSAWAGKADRRAYRAAVSALLRLTTDQRDHAPIKSGLHEEKLLAEEESLYASVDPVQRTAMRQGLGNRVIESLSEQRHVLSADALRCRDQGGDLDHLVQLIVGEL
ncbi:hypothetical protein J2847_000426 [Azospirillum agricola]|uniref:hypothetical protein n=1 Tax=Azospirillum agricola TaxID=1720247 RepID=UPI001AEB30CF|nr:hypothetical protein [Azospirillum agricola]MBP2227159.1 hypothetical protein [Azospirillum agricola]